MTVLAAAVVDMQGRAALRILLGSLLLVSAGAAHAASAEEKKCILAAAEKLPTVPGLAITESRAEAAGGEYRVTIVFDAARQTYTATFDCLVNGPGAVAKMRGLPD